jgi:NAD(P)-dependent dehydrogenase (short-subunit alcohol dehydrogenase family)
VIEMKLKSNDAQRLRNRVVVITGGAGPNSIGRSVSIRFAEEGAKVAVTDINLAGAQAVADEITAGGGIAMALPCDVSDLAQCEAMAKRVADAWGGKIDILFNNAADYRGFMTDWKPFNEVTPEEWDHMHSVNLKGQWFCARAVFPYMKPQHYGKIINIGSTSLFEGIPGFVHYISSKGGVIGLTRGLGKELGEFGIRVNTMCPGFTLSDASLDLASDAPEFLEVRRNAQALKDRNLVPDDMAGPALFLASEDSDMITCQTLQVEAGGIMW